ncbi:unnamed protein product [Schistosoma margrebowiei]|uniref:Uncharacterized protein n=1 Tax=Schistosoma margrebowiei TaxID=48269 RepID=A0A183LAL5_9TREM|nr:unnamed protein product [Schistosoma margrebowiei]
MVDGDQRNDLKEEEEEVKEEEEEEEEEKKEGEQKGEKREKREEKEKTQNYKVTKRHLNYQKIFCQKRCFLIIFIYCYHPSLLPSTGLNARTSVTNATGVTGLSGIAAAAANQQGKPLNLAALTLAAQSVAAKKRAGARAQAANTRPERTLFCLTLRNSLRKVCIKIGEWKYLLHKRFD